MVDLTAARLQKEMHLLSISEYSTVDKARMTVRNLLELKITLLKDMIAGFDSNDALLKRVVALVQSAESEIKQLEYNI